MAIETGKIELQPGVIAPIKRGLWHAACKELQEAAAGVKQMEDAKDRIQYEGGWTRLVDSLEEFWTRFFDDGKNTFSSFQPWTGAIAANSEQGESWYEFSRIPGCLMRTVWASSFIVSPRLADKSVAHTADYS